MRDGWVYFHEPLPCHLCKGWGTIYSEGQGMQPCPNKAEHPK